MDINAVDTNAAEAGENEDDTVEDPNVEIEVGLNLLITILVYIP